MPCSFSDATIWLGLITLFRQYSAPFDRVFDRNPNTLGCVWFNSENSRMVSLSTSLKISYRYGLIGGVCWLLIGHLILVLFDVFFAYLTISITILCVFILFPDDIDRDPETGSISEGRLSLFTDPLCTRYGVFILEDILLFFRILSESAKDSLRDLSALFSSPF